MYVHVSYVHSFINHLVHVYHRGATCAKPADRRRPEARQHHGAPGGTTWILDVGVVRPGPSATSTGHPGRAAEAFAAIKAAKYIDKPNIVPFIVEATSTSGHLFLDTLLRSQGPAPPPTPGPRGTHFRGPSPQAVAQGCFADPRQWCTLVARV
jgi:hypothetical protein